MCHPASFSKGAKKRMNWGELTIDLAAVVANWRFLQSQVEGECAAVVKADAYGLGLAQVGRALWAAGCTFFYVANVDEADQLRLVLSEEGNGKAKSGRDYRIAIFNGLEVANLEHYRAFSYIPVLYCREQVALWADSQNSEVLPSILKVDTGMHRLGFTSAEFSALLSEPDSLIRAQPSLLMSHLACADESGHPLNEEQRQCFSRWLSELHNRLPALGGSLANSSGVMLGAAFHFSQVRPGSALYGVNPLLGETNPMRPVVNLQLPILQVKDVEGPASVGYGATYTVNAGQKVRLAVVAGGYADGLFRALSGSSFVARLGSHQVPLVGRVSMDLCVFDVSAVPQPVLAQSKAITVLDSENGVDALAAAAGTIGYEVLTALGKRYRRCYLSS